MTRASPQAIEARARQIAAHIAKAPGVTRVQLAAALCMSVRSTHDAMAYGKAVRLFDCARIEERVVGWFLPEQMDKAAELAAEHQERIANRAAARTRDFMRRAREAQRSRELADKPVCTRRAVGDPLPFRCTAPASVFHLGGML